MKKITLIICGVLYSLNALAWRGEYAVNVTRDDRITALEKFYLFLTIICIILGIIAWIKLYRMFDDIKKIKEQVTTSDPKVTYLIAIGEIEQAKKATLKMLVDSLYLVYHDYNNPNKAQTMNMIIAERLPKIQRLGLQVPDYVTSGEKFIDYINLLTGNNVQYKR